jgi:nucleoid-associated protein YgaU
MKTSPTTKGLALILLAGSLSLNSLAQTKETTQEYKGSEKETPYMKYARERDKKYFSNTKKNIEVKTADQKDTIKNQEKKEETQEYVIKPGDTFYNLADKFYGTEKDAYWIQKANSNVNPSKLKVGQKIIIPKR